MLGGSSGCTSHPLFCVWQCFAVRSLGWVEMTEEELAPGRSSVAVNNCIRQLSYHKNNLHDPMSGGWGEVRAQLAGVVQWKGKEAVRERERERAGLPKR